MKLWVNFSYSTLLTDIGKLALTFSIALGSGWLFLQIGLPAPFLLGSVFGVWIFGRVIKPAQSYLGVARWFHLPVIFGLGVLIGANFTGDILPKIEQWSVSVSVMVMTTIFVSVIGYLFLHKVRGYEPRLAYLCCIPGGQAEALAMAKEVVDKDYVVALFHLVRVVFVFASTPLLLAFIEGGSAVHTSNLTLQQMPSIFELDGKEMALFIAIALGGYGAARLFRIPMPHLIGPMGLSSLIHLTGWAELPRIHEFVLLAQLAIGGGVGAKLAQIPFIELFDYLKVACLNTMVILSAYFLTALFITYLSGEAFLTIWLAFVPGGLYEVTLLALLFGFDVAFIAFHHTVRVVLIFLSMPAIIAYLKRSN